MKSKTEIQHLLSAWVLSTEHMALGTAPFLPARRGGAFFGFGEQSGGVAAEKVRDEAVDRLVGPAPPRRGQKPRHRRRVEPTGRAAHMRHRRRAHRASHAHLRTHEPDSPSRQRKVLQGGGGGGCSEAIDGAGVGVNAAGHLLTTRAGLPAAMA